jgi:hypothetical protein
VDQSLAEDEHIAFNAGTHDELIQIDYRDFERLVEPTVASLAYEVTVHGDRHAFPAVSAGKDEPVPRPGNGYLTSVR